MFVEFSANQNNFFKQASEHSQLEICLPYLHKCRRIVTFLCTWREICGGRRYCIASTWHEINQVFFFWLSFPILFHNFVYQIWCRGFNLVRQMFNIKQIGYVSVCSFVFVHMLVIVAKQPKLFHFVRILNHIQYYCCSGL